MLERVAQHFVGEGLKHPQERLSAQVCAPWPPSPSSTAPRWLCRPVLTTTPPPPARTDAHASDGLCDQDRARQEAPGKRSTAPGRALLRRTGRRPRPIHAARRAQDLAAGAGGRAAPAARCGRVQPAAPQPAARPAGLRDAGGRAERGLPRAVEHDGRQRRPAPQPHAAAAAASRPQHAYARGPRHAQGGGDVRGRRACLRRAGPAAGLVQRGAHTG
jgi:hypothetical protein